MMHTGLMPEQTHRAGKHPIIVAVVVAFLGMTGPFAIDVLYPAFGQLRSHFDVDAVATQQLISVYLLAYAGASIVYGPLSDAVGRKPVLIGSMVVFVVACVAAVFAQSFTQLLMLRVVQGLSSGGCTTVGRALVRDLFEGKQAQQLIAWSIGIFNVAPALAPTVGGVIVLDGGWRGIFWFLAAFAAVLVVMVWQVLPEGVQPEHRKPLHPKKLATSSMHLLKNPSFAGIAASSSLLFSGYFIYIGSAAIIVTDLLGWGNQSFWRMLGPVVAGTMIGAFGSAWLTGKAKAVQIINASIVAGLLAGALNMAACWMWQDSRPAVALVVPCLIGMVITAAMPILNLAGLDVDPSSRGAAASLMACLNLIVAAAVIGVLVPFVAHSLLGIATASAALLLAGSILWWAVATKASALLHPTQQEPNPQPAGTQ